MPVEIPTGDAAMPGIDSTITSQKSDLNQEHVFSMSFLQLYNFVLTFVYVFVYKMSKPVG